MALLGPNINIIGIAKAIPASSTDNAIVATTTDIFLTELLLVYYFPPA
jgi:hypothetical protein